MKHARRLLDWWVTVFLQLFDFLRERGCMSKSTFRRFHNSFQLIWTSLVVCVAVGAATQSARADYDLSWLAEATTCESLGQGARNFYQSLKTSQQLNDSQRESLKLILGEACGPRFAQCKFEFCSAGALAANAEPAEQTSRPATLSQVSSPAIVTDPLAWLNEPLPCETLVDQIKARYAPLGSYADLPVQKKEELSKVLDIACGPRFSQCNFPSCASRPRTKKDLAVEGRARLNPAAQSVPTESLLAEKFKQEYSARLLQRQQLIENAVSLERSNGLSWKVFSIREEQGEPEVQENAKEAAASRNQQSVSAEEAPTPTRSTANRSYSDHAAGRAKSSGAGRAAAGHHQPSDSRGEFARNSAQSFGPTAPPQRLFR